MQQKDLHILVCIKQVPENDAHVDYDGAVICSDGPCRMNRCDACALESALRLKEAGVAETVDVVTVGLADTEDVLRRAMGMGADNAARIDIPDDAAPCPMTVARLLADYVKHGEYALVMTGAMSEDLMQGITGQTTAALLGWQSAWGVVGLSVSGDPGMAIVDKEIEQGRRLKQQIALPAVLAIQTGIHRPRYPSVSRLLRANAVDVPVSHPERPTPATARSTVVGFVEPAGGRKAEMIAGSVEEKVQRLCCYLADRGLL
jgi:electron transfer flavoprotein beta subunit